MSDLGSLQDYTFYTETKCGFSDDADLQLSEIVKLDTCAEKDKLLMDKMHIKIWCTISIQVISNHSTVIVRYTIISVGAITQFVNLGNINMHLVALEKKVNDGDTSKNSQTPNLAKSMLFFLIKGLLSSLCFPFAHFSCTDLSGELMYSITWNGKLYSI